MSFVTQMEEDIWAENRDIKVEEFKDVFTASGLGSEAAVCAVEARNAGGEGNTEEQERLYARSSQFANMAVFAHLVETGQISI